MLGGWRGAKKIKGKVNIEDLLARGDARADYKLWQDIIGVVSEFEMPTEDETQPGDSQREML